MANSSFQKTLISAPVAIINGGTGATSASQARTNLGVVTDHTGLSNIGTNTHAQLDTHVADVTKHREIDDSSASTTKLWSSSKTNTELGTKAASSHNHDSAYATVANGVTNGDSHDHNGGDGAQINHTTLSNIGSNTHAQVDSHLASTANPHSVTANQVLPSQTSNSGKYLTTDGTNPSWATVSGGGSAITVKDEGTTLTAALTSLDFVGGGVTATNTSGAVTVTIPADAVTSVDGATGAVSLSGTYAPIAKGVTNGDSHDHNGGDGAQINHTTLSNIGTNTHAQIDTHISSTTNPHSVTLAQVGGAPDSAQYVTLATDATLTNERVLTAGKKISITDAGAGSTLTLENRSSHELILLEDEFIGSLLTTGNIGQLAWLLGAGTMAAKAGEATHPGMVQLTTGTTSGTIGRLILPAPGSGTSLSIAPADVKSMKCILRPITGTTTMSVRFGLTNNPATSNEGAQGAYFSFDPATSANWRTITRDASGVTSNSTSVAYTANNWYMLEMRKSGSNWGFYLNNSLVFTHSTNLPSSLSMPIIAVETNEAVDKKIDVDYFSMEISISSQRWT